MALHKYFCKKYELAFLSAQCMSSLSGKDVKCTKESMKCTLGVWEVLLIHVAKRNTVILRHRKGHG